MGGGSEQRWEWMLPGGEQVAATIDPDSAMESVLVGGRVVSQAARGTKPEGHVVPLAGASGDAEPVVVTFDPRMAICILRVGREEVAPARWPGPARRANARPAVQSSFPLGNALAVLALAAVVAGVAIFLSRTSGTQASAPLTSVHRAESGLFVAHFPPAFAARAALVPSGASGVVIEDKARSEAIVIVALTIEDTHTHTLGDPWALQKRLHGEALANLPRGSGSHEETSRTDGTCLGEPGAIVNGRVTSTAGARATLWSCAFRRGAAGYLVMYSLAEADTSGGASRLRGILDATELTRLEDLTNARP